MTDNHKDRINAAINEAERAEKIRAADRAAYGKAFGEWSTAVHALADKGLGTPEQIAFLGVVKHKLAQLELRASIMTTREAVGTGLMTMLNNVVGAAADLKAGTFVPCKHCATAYDGEGNPRITMHTGDAYCVEP